MKHRTATHLCAVNSDGSSRLTRLRNTPSTRTGYDPAFSKAVAVQAAAELARRRLERFGFVRPILGPGNSVLLDADD